MHEIILTLAALTIIFIFLSLAIGLTLLWAFSALHDLYEWICKQ